jgi:hypothetical protein
MKCKFYQICSIAVSTLLLSCLKSKVSNEANVRSESSAGLVPQLERKDEIFICDPYEGAKPAGFKYLRISYRAEICWDLNYLAIASTSVYKKWTPVASPIDREHWRSLLLARNPQKDASFLHIINDLDRGLISGFLRLGLEGVSALVDNASNKQKTDYDREKAKDSNYTGIPYLPGLKTNWIGASEADLRDNFAGMVEGLRNRLDEAKGTRIKDVFTNYGEDFPTMGNNAVHHVLGNSEKSTYLKEFREPYEEDTAGTNEKTTKTYTKFLDIYLKHTELYALFKAYQILLLEIAFPYIMNPPNQAK